MAATPPTADGGAVIELDEEIYGEEIGSRNYRFSKIGESVPINSEFDPQSLPAQPLAISERLRLLFVAYPQGFYVVRTKNVIETAEEIKEKREGPSVKELSLVDVPVGNVSILALSSDDSLLAASVDSHVHFYAVSALLHKDQEPSFSVSLDDSSCIRDVRWAKNAGKSYLIHSADGKLYHGSGQGPLKHVMDGVDSVDWSVGGDSVAVAKSNTISILSSELKEKSRFLLPFQSVARDSDVNQVIKVDSIRWIRPDCIFVGCFQLNDDKEEIYVVQVITSRDGKLTDDPSKPTVLSFSNVFMDFCSDAVPTRNGPHLYLSYLDLYGLAFIANRNLSRQVGLFCWPRDSGKSEASIVEILDDAWNLHIDSQDNDEDNVILGLSVDKVSQNENIRFTLGDVETEVSPCCVIICLTIDGKISIFHFASAAGASVSPEASDEETDASPVLEKNIMPLVSSTAGKGSNDPAFSMSERHIISGFEVEKTGAKATITNDFVPSVNVDTKSLEKTTSGNMGHMPLVYSKPVEADAPEKALPLVSAAGASVSPEASDEETDASPVLEKNIMPLISSTAGKGSNDPAFSMSERHIISGFEVEKTGAKATITNDFVPSVNVDTKSLEKATSGNMGHMPLVYSKPVEADAPEKALPLVSAAGASVSPEASDEETDASPVLEKNIMPLISSTAGKGSNDPAFSMSERHIISGFEVEKTGAKATITNDFVPSVNVDTKSLEKATSGNMGHKPLVYSKPVEADAPEKALPLVLNQVSNAENQSSSEVKQSTGFFSGKLVGDFSHQSITKDSPGRVERFLKAPPTSSQSLWSLSGSSAKVDASEISDGRFLPSDVGNSDKHALQSAGNAVQQPTEINEKVKPFATSTSGQTSSSAQGHRNIPQAYPGSHVPLGETFVIGKSFQSEFKTDLNSCSSATWLSHSVQKKSSAKVDASKTSDGRFLPSDVGNSDKHAVLQSTDINEKVKPFVTSTSIGQTASTAQGHRNPLQEYPGSQVPLRERFSSGKPFQSDLKKDLNSSSSASGLPYSVQNAPKQFGNVEEMTKKLDILIEGIEGKGGFLDASITSQTNSVTELEDSIWALSGRCRTWKGLMNEQLRELQLLLDKTVQVLVRKVYMEGVFKQTTDSRYLELWNRQKLSSELEWKRRRISELNQELTNKLIELERHFNSLEFNKFGETGGMQRNRSVMQNGHGHSRQTQSLHSLHNTMQAQLAAAEQLSGCLSSQMAALSIESSETHDAKKKLFESIGLSFGDTERSPAKNRTSGTPLNKEHLITSTSIASKEHTRRNQTSFAKSPETARRRRDSLDRSWASFEPSKTTVKRVLKEDYDQGNASRSLLNIDKQYPSPQSQKKSESAYSDILRASLNSSKSKGTVEIPDQHTQSRFASLHQKTADTLDNGIQVLSTKISYALPPPSILDTRTTQNSEQATFKLIDDKSKGSLPFIGKKDSFAAGVSNFVRKQPDTSLHPSPPSISSQQSLKSSFVATETSDHFKLGFTKSKTDDQKKNTWTESGTTIDSKIPVNPASAFFGSGTNASEKGSFTKHSEKSNQPSNDNSKASIPSQPPVGSSLFSSNNVPSFASFSKPSSSTLFPVTPSSSGFSVSTKQEVLQPQTSSIHESNLSFISPSSSSSIGKSESQTSSLSHTPVDNTPPETEKDISKIQQVSASQPGFSSTSGLKLGPATSSSPTELSTDQKVNSGGFSNISSSVASVLKTEQLPSATEGIIGSVKMDVPNSSHEEEMEEEAPEATELSLGSLGGFGIGSAPSSATPKPNPFGVVNLNQNTSFTLSPNSGELFRPASFNFQPLQQQPPQPVQPMTVNFSGAGNSGQPVSGFGQPTHIGAGQQALGTVLGSFGQSRQLGAGLPGGNNVAPAISFGGGGFGGGFASAAPSAGGFAGLAVGSGGFAAAGGGFAAAATGGGGGFGGFGNQQGGGSGFSAFGGGSTATRPPSQAFTQMRK